VFTSSFLVFGAAAYCAYEYREQLRLAGSGISRQTAGPDQTKMPPRPATIIWQQIDQTQDDFKPDMRVGA
jgi:hypothetical protein